MNLSGFNVDTLLVFKLVTVSIAPNGEEVTSGIKESKRIFAKTSSNNMILPTNDYIKGNNNWLNNLRPYNLNKE